LTTAEARQLDGFVERLDAGAALTSREIERAYDLLTRE
jgi:hypothetical protein